MDQAGAGPGPDASEAGGERTTDTVDHLRAAAHELIGAARSFLDVAEQLVDDPRAGEAVVDTVTALAESVRRGARSAVRDSGASKPGDTYEHIDLTD
jgi:hypothetical protein